MVNVANRSHFVNYDAPIEPSYHTPYVFDVAYGCVSIPDVIAPLGQGCWMTVRMPDLGMSYRRGLASVEGGETMQRYTAQSERYPRLCFGSVQTGLLNAQLCIGGMLTTYADGETQVRAWVPWAGGDMPELIQGQVYGFGIEAVSYGDPATTGEWIAYCWDPSIGGYTGNRYAEARAQADIALFQESCSVTFGVIHDPHHQTRYNQDTLLVPMIDAVLLDGAMYTIV